MGKGVTIYALLLSFIHLLYIPHYIYYYIVSVCADKVEIKWLNQRENTLKENYISTRNKPNQILTDDHTIKDVMEVQIKWDP